MKRGDLIKTWSHYMKKWEYGIVLGRQIHVSPVNKELYEFLVYFFHDHQVDPVLEKHMEIISET